MSLPKDGLRFTSWLNSILCLEAMTPSTCSTFVKDPLAGRAFVKLAMALKIHLYTGLTEMLGFWHARGTNEKCGSLNYTEMVSSVH